MKFSQLSIRATLLVIISTLNILLAVLVGSGVYRSWENMRHINDLKKQSATINLFYNAEKYLSLERGLSMAMINAPPELADAVHVDLLENRELAGTKLAVALSAIRYNDAPGIASLMDIIAADRQNLRDTRAMIDQIRPGMSKEERNAAYKTVFDTFTNIITDLDTLIKVLSQPVLHVNATVSQQMFFKHFIWEITEYAGREYAQIGRLIAEDEEPPPRHAGGAERLERPRGARLGDQPTLRQQRESRRKPGEGN